MGIHPYGLFGTTESNNAFGANYELKRQLQTRKAQLDELSKKESLSDSDLKRQEQLTNTVSKLSDKLNKTSETDNYNSNRRTFVEGTVIAKPSPYANAISNQNANTTVNSQIAKVTANNQAAKPPVNNIDNSYLKGFFLDIKI